MASPARSEGGFTLVEALIALAVLAIAVSGGIAVINHALSQQARIMENSQAERLARNLLVEPPADKTGQFQLRTNGPVARWELTETIIQSGPLGGVELDWVRYDLDVVWQSGDRTQDIHIQRIALRPSPASP